MNSFADGGWQGPVYQRGREEGGEYEEEGKEVTRGKQEEHGGV